MDDPYCPGRKTRVQLGTVEGLDLQCVYPVKSDAPKRWLEVQSHYLLMPSPGTPPQCIPYRVEPFIQVFSDSHLSCIEDKATVPVRHRLGELLRHLCLCLAVEVTALVPDCVLSHPHTVLAPVDASLSSTPSLGHALHPSKLWLNAWCE